jgi:hypothetical protein
MRLLMFVSAFGILISLAVLIAVIIKAKKSEQSQDERPPERGRNK